MQIGALVGVADSGTQLVYWQTRAGTPAQMTALLHRYEPPRSAGSRPTLIVAALVLLAGLGRIASEPPQRATTAVAAGTA
jgi:hypothetical protein